MLRTYNEQNENATPKLYAIYLQDETRQVHKLDCALFYERSHKGGQEHLSSVSIISGVNFEQNLSQFRSSEIQAVEFQLSLAERNSSIYFIFSSEINAYQKQIKVISVTIEMI